MLNIVYEGGVQMKKAKLKVALILAISAVSMFVCTICASAIGSSRG
jgi:hypothetical protein